MNSSFQSIYQEVDIALIAHPLIPCVLWRVTNIITVCGQSHKTDDIDPCLLVRQLHGHMFVPAALQNIIVLLLNSRILVKWAMKVLKEACVVCEHSAPTKTASRTSLKYFIWFKLANLFLWMFNSSSASKFQAHKLRICKWTCSDFLPTYSQCPHADLSSC